MAARYADNESVALTADGLRGRLADLADADVAAYTHFIRARADGADNAGDVAAALAEAVRVPLQIAEGAANVAELARELAATGNPRLSGDADTACRLAAAAAQSACQLVRENLRSSPDPAQLGRVDRLERRTARCVDALPH